MSEETLDRGWLSGIYWKLKYDELLADHQRLVHEHEELKNAKAVAGRGNNDGSQQDLAGGL